MTRSSTINSIITQSVIDLAFATKSLFQQIADWYVDDSIATSSNHEVIKLHIKTKIAISIDNPLCSNFFNFKKVDWKQFSEEILTQTQYIDFSHLNLLNLNEAALSLQNAIYIAAEKSIKKRRFIEKSKPW